MTQPIDRESVTVIFVSLGPWVVDIRNLRDVPMLCILKQLLRSRNSKPRHVEAVMEITALASVRAFLFLPFPPPCREGPQQSQNNWDDEEDIRP